jgi:GNAT superfamily N-acetyltransferase
MHGYLAFEDDQLIGWANAGHWENYPRLSAYATPYANMDTAMIVCFFVDPRYRQKGVMNALLSYALDDLKGLGYVQVLVMPQAKTCALRRYSGSFNGTNHMDLNHWIRRWDAPF